jgi:hypothetical protein
MRISKGEQTTALQEDALAKAAVERTYRDVMSGVRDDRPQFQAMLDFARSGDTIVVWQLDRLGRSLKHLIFTPGGSAHARSLARGPWTSSSHYYLPFFFFHNCSKKDQVFVRVGEWVNRMHIQATKLTFFNGEPEKPPIFEGDFFKEEVAAPERFLP